MKKPLILIIRDGWGISPNGQAAAQKEGNAPLLGKTPFHDRMFATYPWSKVSASGEDVGLPDGQMGNSEVGHLNLGAGRIVYQDITRINKAIKDGELAQNAVLLDFLRPLASSGHALHLMGLVSDGGVHSHQDQLVALVRIAKDAGVKKICVHAITDGRDTAPDGGIGYLKKLQADLQAVGAGEIVTLIGRYYAMDRDKRWERTQLAYDLFVKGEGEKAADPVAALEKSYAEKITDEFVKPVLLTGLSRPLIRDGDGILFFNFRSDRGRQLTEALLDPAFSGFERQAPKVSYATLTRYNEKYDAWGVKVIFPPQSMDNILGKVLSAHGLKQCRLAETEKYPHVTFFFNGGVETPYPGEDREVIASPKVATYDLQPEMSAPEVTEAVLRRLGTGEYDAIILNFANPDMVGHTGILKAAIKAVETIDQCLEKVVTKVLEMGGTALVTADHGNCERMITDDGKPHTAHTTNLVHFVYVAADHAKARLRDGILADVAPTILHLLGLPQPKEMTGRTLVERA
jgi:2,3-bisphosphoglycerate-independent phosphoglycerate mutase